MASLKHGLDVKRQEIVSINDVASGLGCNCLCPSCGEKLVARKGEINQWHFAHNSNESCEYAEQTAVHLIAKDIIARHGVFLPRSPFNDFVKNQLNELNSHALVRSTVLTQTGNYIRFDKITLEKKISNIIPDIIAEYNGVTILIEIAVTHFIDATKLEKLKVLGLPCLEIDCSHLRGSENLEEDLIQFLLASEVKRKWIINPNCKIIDFENLIAQKNTIKNSAAQIIKLQSGVKHIERNAKFNYKNYKTIQEGSIPEGFDIQLQKDVYKNNEVEFYNQVSKFSVINNFVVHEVIHYRISDPFKPTNDNDVNECVAILYSDAANWLLNHLKQLSQQAYKELEQAKIELANLEKDYNPEIEIVIKCEI